jgi:hypothetical protein
MLPWLAPVESGNTAESEMGGSSEFFLMEG